MPGGGITDRVFGIDLRAIVALRVVLGVLVLASLADRLRDFSAFYTDVGVLPQSEAWNGTWFAPWDGASHLHPFAWLPDPWGSLALFGLAAVAAALLLVGWHPKPAAFAAWLMLTGIDNRNPLVINAGDDLLRMLLFWGLFLPLSARGSNDARRIVSAGTVAFVVQLAIVYFASAAFKSYRAWVSDGDALHFALHLEQFVTPAGIALREHLPTRLVSQATWFLEGVAPLLIFSPFATGALRVLLFLLFTGLHLGIDLTLGIGLFSYACIAAWIVLLPSGFWDRVSAWIPVTPPATEPAPARAALASQPLCAFLLVYVVAWNVWSLDPGRHETWFPHAVRRLGYELRLGQLWAMFSPEPSEESNWLELGAQTPDGTAYWLSPDGRLIDDLPATPERLLTERSRKLHERIQDRRSAPLAARYAAFLLRELERTRVGPARLTITWVKRKSPAMNARSDTLPEAQSLLAVAGLRMDHPVPRRPRVELRSTSAALPK